MEIKIIGIKADNNLGKVITYFTKGKYSHTALLINGIIYEARIFVSKYYEVRNGVFCRKAGELKKDEITIKEFKEPLTDAQIRAIEKFCIINIGRRYNLALLLWLGVIWKFRDWYNKHQNLIPYKQEVFGYICPEFVYDACNEAGRQLVTGIDKHLLSPDDILESELLYDVLNVTKKKLKDALKRLEQALNKPKTNKKNKDKK